MKEKSCGIPPPQKYSFNKKLSKKLIASAVFFAFYSSLNWSLAANDLIVTDQDNYRFKFNAGENKAVYDNLSIKITPEITHDYYIFNIKNNQSLLVTNNTIFESISDKYNGNSGDHPCTYAFEVESGGSIELKGNVSAVMIHSAKILSGDIDSGKYVGANIFYAKDGGQIAVGEEGRETFTNAWAIGPKPDLISAKNGGKVVLHSKHNQLVGNIDTIDTDFGTKESSVTATFSGNDSYWFGDEQTFNNLKIVISSLIPDMIPSLTLKDKEDIEKLLKLDCAGLGIDDSFKSVLQGVLTGFPKIQGSEIHQNIDLVFENGAQWTYFGDKQEINYRYSDFVWATLSSTPKRISSITLNAGIINLYDEDIQRTWQEIGLTDVWNGVKDIKHDYVRIGDLKGNGGIFRLDLDANNKQNSDMVLIESSSTGGQHYIEPYNLERLESVSPTNTLTFALTHKNANQEGKAVTFADKENFYVQHLFDYELEIDSREIQNAEQISDISYDSFKEDGWEFDPQEFVDGKEWFIKRVNLIESAASIGMRSAGYASYDLATSMDRRDRRLQNAVFQNDEKDGLWARIQYGEAGAEHFYDADLTTVYVGYEKATSADNRLGVSFAYTDGESDFSDLKGSGDLKRYEASIYDTLTFGSHYLDFVARFGQVDNEFDVTNQAGALSTSGSFDQKYAAPSAEYGYNFKDEHNVFIEPQLQLQVAYLGDYDYRTERSMKVKADDDMSVIGRMGLRVGKAFEASNYAAELYARADVLHQFTDGQDAVFSDVSHKVDVNWGDKDTWSTFGVGGYFNWKDNMSLQMDIEKTAGGETADTWVVSGRFNYLF